MARPGNIEPTARGPEQEDRWKRKAAERINYLLDRAEALEKRVAALETP